MSFFRSKPLLKVLALTCLIGGVSCDGQDAKTETIDDWPPSAEHEAMYLQRVDNLVKAYQAGKPENVYDTLVPIKGTSSPASASEIEPEHALSKDLRDTINQYADANNSQALIVYHKGEIIHETYFNGYDADSLIVGKSLAKPMGVIAVGAAIKKGHIKNLDQPLADFFHEWKDTPKSDIKIRQILDMTSGLYPQEAVLDPNHIINRAFLHPRHDEVIIRDYPLVNEPGKRYDYSNANSELVAPLIKRATGINYEDWLSTEVLSPLSAPGGEIWLNRDGGTAHSGCCLLLPARSWLKLAELVLNDGIINGTQKLPSGFVEQMRTPTPLNENAGMGVYIGQPYQEFRGFLNPEINFGKSYHSEPYVDDDLILFDGNSNQVIYIIPSKDLIILRLGKNPPKDPIWDNSFLPNVISKEIGN